MTMFRLSPQWPVIVGHYYDYEHFKQVKEGDLYWVDQTKTAVVGFLFQCCRCLTRIIGNWTRYGQKWTNGPCNSWTTSGFEWIECKQVWRQNTFTVICSESL